MEVQAFLKAVLRVLLVLALALGSSYRYLRTFAWVPSGFGALPWAVLSLLAVVTLLLYLATMPPLNTADLALIFLTSLIGLTYLLRSRQFGVSGELPFAGNFLLPLPVFFAVRLDDRINPVWLERLLIPFSLIAASLSIVEFYTINFGHPIFNFSTYWNDVGNIGYHASAVHYALLGVRNRPWGILALPEASGALMAALSIYFAAGRKTPLRLACLSVCFLATYVSGSRTAIVTVAVFGLVLVWTSQLSRFLKLISITVALAAGVAESLTLMTFYAPQLELHGFLNETLGNFWKFISPADPLSLLTHLFVGGGAIVTQNSMTEFTGEVALLNWAAYLGILAWAIAGITFLAAISRYLKLRQYAAADALAMRPAYLLLLALAFGSLHYDALSRYPTNVLIMAILALLLRPQGPAADAPEALWNGTVPAWEKQLVLR